MKGAQLLDPDLVKIRDDVLGEIYSNFSISEDGIIHLDVKLYITNDEDIKK